MLRSIKYFKFLDDAVQYAKRLSYEGLGTLIYPIGTGYKVFVCV
jgi:hypothetical protein